MSRLRDVVSSVWLIIPISMINAAKMLFLVSLGINKTVVKLGHLFHPENLPGKVFLLQSKVCYVFGGPDCHYITVLQIERFTSVIKFRTMCLNCCNS